MFAILRARINRLQKYKSGTVKTLGLVEVLLGVMLLFTGIYAFLSGEAYAPFMYPAPFFIFLGLFQYLRFSYNQMSSSLGILLMLETWAVGFVAAILPFYIYGFPLIDAVYEGISGFTTTGSTIMDGIESADSAVLLWRALIQWAGGITVVIIFTFLLPMIGLGGKNFGSNEFGGSDNGEYAVSLGSASMNFFRIYIFLTAAETVILIILGVSAFDSVCISMSNVPTGGLLPFNDSMAGFGFGVQLTTLVFMILGASNFLFMFRLFFQKDFSLLKSREWKMMIFWFSCVAVFMTVVVWYDGHFHTDNIWQTFWNSFYAVSCAGTSSGFAVTNYVHWPAIAILLLMVVEFVGGTSGSTAGGIKIYRLMTLKAYIMAGIDKIMHPNAVTSMEVDGSQVDPDAAVSVISTVVLFMVGILTGMGLILFFESSVTPGFGFDNVVGLTVSSIANAGAAIGDYGPMDSMVSLLPETKITMCALMILGRMEMVFVLMIFTKRFWRDVKQSSAPVRGKALETVRFGNRR